MKNRIKRIAFNALIRTGRNWWKGCNKACFSWNWNLTFGAAVKRLFVQHSFPKLTRNIADESWTRKVGLCGALVLRSIIITVFRFQASSFSKRFRFWFVKIDSLIQKGSVIIALETDSCQVMWIFCETLLCYQKDCDETLKLILSLGTTSDILANLK